MSVSNDSRKNGLDLIIFTTYAHDRQLSVAYSGIKTFNQKFNCYDCAYFRFVWLFTGLSFDPSKDSNAQFDEQ
jgi:hypothetical protein